MCVRKINDKNINCLKFVRVFLCLNEVIKKEESTDVIFLLYILVSLGVGTRENNCHNWEFIIGLQIILVLATC